MRTIIYCPVAWAVFFVRELASFVCGVLWLGWVATELAVSYLERFECDWDSWYANRS